eukprot:TRINITY_DN4471_c0_g1_i2.p1 TRINITY_DN4471_c0_g1~~TRINITY_DN4471_c0_g1_i2.p1  ORF type:complete len:204 (+),score=33.70 TRINITY_DN4471_c0_g1_i2:115-726(+)
MSINGLMIINTDTGRLLYERDYTESHFGLLIAEGLEEGVDASFADSLNLSAYIYSMIKLHESSFGEESSNNRVVTISGPTCFFFEHSANSPLVLVIIYNRFKYDVIQVMAPQLLETFLKQYRRKLLSKDTIRHSYPYADSLLLPVYETLITLSVKHFVTDLYKLNFYVPWVYLCLWSKPKTVHTEGVSIFSPPAAKKNISNIM